MVTTSRHARALVAAVPCAVSAGLLALLSTSCLADVAPESGLLAHVQSVTGSCETSITDCDQIVRSTTADGPLEFLLFFMRGAYSWPGETLCLHSLRNALSWPETWQLVEFQPCGPWPDYWLDPNGTTHALDIDWYYPYVISDQPGGVVPVARLVMNVVGPGRLDIVAHEGQNPVELLHDCWDSPFVTYPVQAYAEAGMQCGYISFHCGTYAPGYQCEPAFYVPELLLSAPTETPADTTVDFWATYWYWTEGLCPMAVDTHAPWCTAWIDPVHEPGRAHLHVRADADGLAPGLYETEIELFNTDWGVGRCLPLEFAVEEASASVDENPPTTPPVTWGRIKALYR